MLAYSQGALSIQDTMKIVTSRAKLMTTHCPPKSSGMVACKLHYLQGNAMLIENQKLSGLCVACKNTMADCVLSGPLDQVFYLSKYVQIEESNRKGSTSHMVFIQHRWNNTPTKEMRVLSKMV